MAEFRYHEREVPEAGGFFYFLVSQGRNRPLGSRVLRSRGEGRWQND